MRTLNDQIRGVNVSPATTARVHMAIMRGDRSIDEICLSTGRSRGTVNRAIEGLAEAGLVHWGSGRKKGTLRPAVGVVVEATLSAHTQ